MCGFQLKSLSHSARSRPLLQCRTSASLGESLKYNGPKFMGTYPQPVKPLIVCMLLAGLKTPINLLCCDAGINARSSTKSAKAHYEMVMSYCGESGGLGSAKDFRSAWIRGSNVRAAAASLPGMAAAARISVSASSSFCICT